MNPATARASSTVARVASTYSTSIRTHGVGAWLAGSVHPARDDWKDRRTYATDVSAARAAAAASGRWRKQPAPDAASAATSRTARPAVTRASPPTAPPPTPHPAPNQ